jgi:hypothetical protein
MIMSEELIKNAKYFAGLPYMNEELDDILDLKRGTVEAAVENADSELGRAIRAGRLITKGEIYESIQESARRHSTPAQQMAISLW